MTMLLAPTSYLLDTNTCIRYLNGRAPHVRTRLQSISPTQVGICTIVKAEIFAGSAHLLSTSNV
jgi:tRNA(fMet)-specific endonuclease VapC